MKTDGNLGDVLFTSAQIRSRVQELGACITRDYADKELTLVGVLKGGAMFAADLARAVRLSVSLEWIRLSTYADGAVAGEVRRKGVELDADLRGRHVLLVEDLIDSGVTLAWLRDHLVDFGPASVESCVLMRMHKEDQIEDRPVPRYVGFEVPSTTWVAGYGIDYADRHRNLPDIHEYQLPLTAA
ncbi:hypoxanthine phosphoribosyltransferase [Streptomyces sp. NBRC 13847]|uniref:phosphoribosyltransferase n=1 Tax=Streptomyces TaxID=1883 RepID=UPI0024A18E15|nr:phosphoribosyltransferase family protein [Streptomyces sp. NBRC 13847]GLW15714.1 hypoxanthine phosphoribosyltransferase [Streptomyces sp. NBRC 13847]